LFILVGGYDGIYCGVWIKSARSWLHGGRSK
jgi:hypothetical protein